MLEAKYSRKDDLMKLQGESLTPEDEVAWPAPEAPEGFIARVQLPGSKSLIARELVLSALAAAPSKIRNPLSSRDSELMVDALRSLGVKVDWQEDVITVTPPEELLGSTSIECGLAGTVMRFVPPLATLALGPTYFDGDPYARKRPMSALLDALRNLGADIADDGSNTLPFTVHGTGGLKGGYVEVDASLSSQFVSALLLVGARFEDGLHVKHTGEKLPSLPHIEMTMQCLRERGVRVSSPKPYEWVVEASEISGRDFDLEPDLSNAAPFLAAAVVTGSTVSISNWPQNTTQVGDELRTLLKEFGAEVTFDEDDSGQNTVTVTGPKKVKAVNLHIPHAGELSPTLIGIAAFADAPSTITGIGHIRHHETDRIAGLIAELKKIGCDARELEDGVEIIPAPKYNPAKWQSYDDHRMATTGAVIGLKVPGVEVINIKSTSKTMPEFTNMWQAMLAGDSPAGRG